MKKGKLFFGLAASLLGVATLASCGGKGVTTDLEDAVPVTSDVLKEIVEDDDYKVEAAPSVRVVEANDDYSLSPAISGLSWCMTRTTAEGTYLYSLFAGKDICNMEDVYSIRKASSSSYFVTVINEIQAASVDTDSLYNYDVYDYLGNKVVSYTSESSYDYSFDQYSYTYYDDDDNYHNLYMYKLQKSDLDFVKFYYDYCQDTKKISYTSNDPRGLDLGKPGYEEYGDGTYVKVEELTDGMYFYLATDTADYARVKIPSNVNGMFIANNKMIYQTVKLLPDEAKDYSYFVIDPTNGETIKYELVSYSYDFNTSSLEEIELDYVITGSRNYDLTKTITEIKFVKLENGEYNKDRNTLIGFVDSEGVIKYTTDNDADLYFMTELDSGNFYDGDVLYDSNLNVITEVYRRLNADLFIDNDQNRIYDKTGKIVKEFNDYNSTSYSNIINLDGDQYELVGSNVVKLADNEVVYNGFIYKLTKLNPTDDTSAEYKMEVRLAGYTQSVTYYSNGIANLSSQSTVLGHTYYVANYGTIYSDQAMEKEIAYIIFS